MRVLLFGVDGLTFRILDPYIERGLLPHFQRLRDQGVQGTLESIIPPLTPPAWVSMFTGLRSAQHGVYDFWDYEQTPHGSHPPVVTHRKGGKAVWNVLSEWGKRVVIVNVPLTYPPEPVNGIMLSGYMAPDMQSNVTYPASFKEELLREVPGYQIDLDPAVQNLMQGDILAETLTMTRARIAMLKLSLRKPWDFFFIAFSGADRIQHHRWDEIVSFHPQAVQYYQMLDEALGMALDALQAEDILMVTSDHGFQGVQRKFNIQDYLLKEGWLKAKDETYRRTQRVESLKSVLRRLKLQKAIHAFGKMYRRLNRQQAHDQQGDNSQAGAHAAKLPNIDWEHSRAWVPSTSGWLGGYADIVFSDAVTEAEIQALQEAILKLRDPETGQALAKATYREDALGTGPFVSKERHLIVIANETINIHAKLGRAALWETTSWSMGTHHPDGVLFLYGATVKKSITISPVQIYDVMPTILSYMDVPIPEGLAGKVMEEAFELPEAAPSPKQAEESGSVVKKRLQKLAALSENKGV